MLSYILIGHNKPCKPFYGVWYRPILINFFLNERYWPLDVPNPIRFQIGWKMWQGPDFEISHTKYIGNVWNKYCRVFCGLICQSILMRFLFSWRVLTYFLDTWIFRKKILIRKKIFLLKKCLIIKNNFLLEKAIFHWFFNFNFFFANKRMNDMNKTYFNERSTKNFFLW